MNKHTAGEWHVGGQQKCTIYDKFGQRIANSFEGVMATHRTDIECEANARLIAAAPQLLALLVESQRSIGGDWRERRDSAIAKATGEQE